jgi:hemoglobin
MARIYVRLGGAQAFEALVEELDRRILQDLRLRSYFDGVGLERLQHHQRSFLAMAFGGPPGYLGRTVEAAHSRLDVTDEAFDRVLDHLIAALADHGVSRELIREVACTLLPLRHDIVRAAGPPPGLGLSGLVCKFVRGGHAARASCSCSSRRCSSRSRSARVKCQSNGAAVCS